MPPPPKPEADLEDKAGLVPSRGIAVDCPTEEGVRPTNVRHVSSPSYESPLRHHMRKRSSAREVKETLHAHSEYTNSHDDGAAIHRINQYVIKEEIGRGSFGAVHLASDAYGVEYAVKEFSKSRLRKRAQSNILRRPHNAARRTGQIATGLGFNAPFSRQSTGLVDQEEGNPLFLIKEEIAIMKKLNHTNLVSLIEVLDDPNEDSLYMVLEMCKKGVVMKVGVDERADPYDEESCRCWFRDLILGVEYLHAQGVVHRDIKPDNLLLTEDDVLKIVDFGVSEIFEKQSEMLTAKSAGSPAFLPPELCVAKHGDISGKAADIWSMGVTLYCLRFGRIPFEQHGVLQLYESIKNDEVNITPDDAIDQDFRDLMGRLLEKDPAQRIKMPELRTHPWVTKKGKDPLLPEEDNTANLVEPPTEEEMNDAITSNFGNVLYLMKAVKRFKNIIAHKRPPIMESILGQDARIVQPPASISASDKPPLHHKSKSADTDNRIPVEQVLAAEGVHRIKESQIPTGDSKTLEQSQEPRSEPHDPSSTTGPKRDLHAHPEEHRAPHPGLKRQPTEHLGRGQAHDPLSEHLYLALGSTIGSRPPSPPEVSESPSAAESNIYENAYENEIERLRSIPGRSTTLFLTRRVENEEKYRLHEDLIGNLEHDDKPKAGLAKLFDQVKTAKGSNAEDDAGRESNPAPSNPRQHGDIAGLVKNVFSK